MSSVKSIGSITTTGVHNAKPEKRFSTMERGKTLNGVKQSNEAKE